MTLGFEPGPLVRAVASHNLKQGGLVLVLMPSFRDRRGETAFLELKKICDMMFGDAEIKLQRVEIDLTNFTEAVKQIKDLFKNFVDKKAAICFSGGMRALCLATYTAYLLLKWRFPPVIEVQLEGRVERISIPLLHKVINMSVTEEKVLLLKVLSQHGPLTTNDIATLLHKDRSTVYRHLTRLLNEGLVKQKGKYYELTDLGMLLL